MPSENDCPLCGGALKLLKSRIGSNGITTQYRRCECGAKATDKVRKTVVRIGVRRIVKPDGQVLFQSNPHPADSAASVVPGSPDRS